MKLKYYSLIIIFLLMMHLLPTSMKTLLRWGGIIHAGDTGHVTVDVIKTISPKLRPSMKKLFEDKGCEYPPKKVTFIAIKNENKEVWGEGKFEVWSPNKEGKWLLIKEYKICMASGKSGPKLVQGDCQVPEGIYSIAHLNPASSYHLSMKVSYPSEFDKAMAKKDGRTRLGGDIFIHGSCASVGCLAMGDDAIEELFLLAYDTGIRNIKVIITPYDFRDGEKDIKEVLSEPHIYLKKWPEWVTTLYENIKKEITKYPKEKK